MLEKPPIHHIIIDCSTLNYIDTFGVKILNQIINDYKEISVTVYLAECNDATIDRFTSMSNATHNVSGYVPKKLIHLTLHDAFIHAIRDSQKKILNKKF